MSKLILFLALLGLAAPAVAQETRASAAAKFDKEFAASDANRNGVLDRAEVQARMQHMKVGGGKDLDAVHAKRVADLWFANADTNKDGKVTRAEAQALLARTFDRYEAERAAALKAR